MNSGPAPPPASELEDFFDLSIDLLCIVGFDGHFKRVNPALERTLGYPRPELFERTVFEITHPDDVEPSRAALSQLAEGQDLVAFESRIVCADGSVHWLEWNTRTRPERGVVYGVARDTTARRQAEAELRDAQRLLEASRDELRVLAGEQAALRRVATLVARETPPDAVFAAVAREVGELLGVDAIHVGRYDADDTVVSVAQWGRYAGPAIGERFPLDGESISARVWRSGRSARMDSYEHALGPIAARIREIGIRVSIGVPISVQGRPWGVMIASSNRAEPLRAETEARLRDFTELVATAIANAEARAEVARLADEQAALRRVATLVAEGAHPSAVFEAVTREVAEILAASAVSLTRHTDGALRVVATSGRAADVDGANVMSAVMRTGRTARIDELDLRSAVAAPVVVEGRVWGVLAAIWGDGGGPAPEDTEERMARFAELVDTAIANADSRNQLAASRARVLAAGDDARRRVVRDLHDGAQQRLVQAIVALKLAERALPGDSADAGALLAEARHVVEQATAELRELAHGILPSALTRGGLRDGVRVLASRLDLAIDVDVTGERFAPEVEASAFFIVAEALTNVIKHAEARRASVSAVIDAGVLAVEIRDDGVGGADPGGHGLVGIADRVDALGGRLRIDSPLGGGTVLLARLPLAHPG